MTYRRILHNAAYIPDGQNEMSLDMIIDALTAVKSGETNTRDIRLFNVFLRFRVLFYSNF